MGEAKGIYKKEIIHVEMCKKHLHFDIESCRIIKHSKSARQNEIKNCQGFEKKIKKVVDKTNSNCYTKQAVARDQSGRRGPKKQAKNA
ncbi:MAG: hypothetical protein CVV04_03470 [Firmicutes bacterium HGW-Firmicutes-9]|nr:MAG: hypothetical protein CVV04_03470 [Firmicutes bacterium HGW-Firmicutes-9]